MASRPRMIIDILRRYPDQQFTARQLAQKIIELYGEQLTAKRNNPRFKDENAFLKQITAEMNGPNIQRTKALCPQVMTRDQPRPRLFYWAGSPISSEPQSTVDTESRQSSVQPLQFSEHELYPLLIRYLSEEEGLYCRRIDEKRSLKNKGTGANHWLYPDIVALETLDKHWHTVVQNCARNGGTQTSRLWSFEVKKQLNRSNVRECFFQAVSNSSWAQLGYLVTSEINEDRRNGVERELQMLCALHGIGVILLDPNDISNSQTLIPARERDKIDWHSVNRLVEENTDFKQFIDLVADYHQTGKVREALWNKIKE